MPVARRSRTPRAVLILAHARDRGAVTAARALRRAGWRVGLGSSRADGGLAGASDAVHALHPVPRPSGEQGAFLRGLGAALAEGRYDVVVGSGDDWMAALAHHRERLTATVAHPAAAVVAAGMDKLTLHRMAQDAGLATPATRTLAPEPWQEVALPVVVKNRRHWTPHHDRRHRIETAVCRTSAELERHLLAFASEHDEPVLQEPVDGVLSALIGVVHEGRLTGRVQQVSPCVFPTPSGASARARTVPVDPVLAERCELLLGRLGWSGLVELQFLVGRDGVHRLIDLNGRFFGSLALAEAARPGLVDAGLRAGAVCPCPSSRTGDPGCVTSGCRAICDGLSRSVGAGSSRTSSAACGGVWVRATASPTHATPGRCCGSSPAGCWRSRRRWSPRRQRRTSCRTTSSATKRSGARRTARASW
ncbi:hypothetical protein BJF80_14160 [Serinicoccus sp. CUA-874]|uniref:hypothetical protein n=1 Tax=Serinicoccus sp. CUA-874 TaxID=1517939 RepID=UPI000966D869|nr:hypothetical protein [Serinicoccus sp. CUA-874]OLT18975.1 hypothetical protein BJF80_14160 [Serinicoccus sp. CUA-874]